MSEETTSTETTSTETTAPASVVNADGSFTENFYGSHGDENKEYLSRYKTTDDLAKANISMRKKFSKDPNSLVEIPNSTSSDEVKAAYRTAMNVPDTSDKYEYAIPDELAVKLGPLDDAKIAKFQEFAHGQNWSQTQYKEALDFYHNNMSEEVDTFGVQTTENTAKAKAEGLQVLAQEYKGQSATVLAEANAIFDKYGLKDVKLPDGSMTSIKGMLLESHPTLLTDPYFAMLLKEFRGSLSEDTLKGLGGSGGVSPDSVKSQIADVREQMDTIQKENPSNFKGNTKFKILQEKKRNLYKQMPA